jgi:MFS transporter, YNFM family, putative membrane transport protein
MIDPRTLAVILTGFCAFIDLYATQTLLPLLARQYDASPAAVGMTVSATTLAVALIAPFTGVVADLLGRRRIIVTAMFLLVVPTVLIALAGSLGEIVLWRFIQGLLLPPIFAVMVAYIAEEAPPERTVALTGLYSSASSVGGFAGRFVTGWVGEHVGWQAAFLALALITLCCAAGVAALLPPERRFVKSAGVAASVGAMLRHLRDPRLLATNAVGFAALFSLVAIFTYINFHLAAPPFLLSPAALGLLFIVYLAGAAVTPFAGWLVARLGRRQMVMAAAAVWAAGLALTLVPHLGIIVLGLGLSTGGGFLCTTAAMSFVAQSAPEARSAAVGLYVTSYYIGGSAGGVVPGLVWTATGWPGCIAIVAAVLAALVTLVLRFWREAR